MVGNNVTPISIPAVQNPQHKQEKAECCGHSL